MGKALIWLGKKISILWCKLMCWWNGLLYKLTVKVKDCPNTWCKCSEG